MPIKTKKQPNILKELPEKLVHIQVCSYINAQFPNVIFSSDPSGLRVTEGLRQEINRKSPKKWKVPDLIVLEPRKGYNGLVIEIKRKGERITKKNGDYVNEHVAEQAKSLARLKEAGYCACFGVGFEDCVAIVNDYLKT